MRRPERVLTWHAGSDARYEAFLKEHPTAEQIECSPGPGTKPWGLAAGLTPAKASLDTEHWGLVLQEVVLDVSASDPEAMAAEFMAAATEFANSKVWGSLSCAAFVHPATMGNCRQVRSPSCGSRPLLALPGQVHRHPNAGSHAVHTQRVDGSRALGSDTCFLWNS